MAEKAMKQRRCFTIEFKRQVIEELLNGISTPHEICRVYNLDLDTLHEWNIQYNMGRFDTDGHGISAPLAYLTASEDLRPSVPSAYIRVLGMLDSSGTGENTASRSPFISTN